MRNKFKQQKSSQISLRADCHSWRSGLGWQTLCGVNRCNISQGTILQNKKAPGFLREPIAIVGGVSIKIEVISSSLHPACLRLKPAVSDLTKAFAVFAVFPLSLSLHLD